VEFQEEEGRLVAVQNPVLMGYPLMVDELPVQRILEIAQAGGAVDVKEQSET